MNFFERFRIFLGPERFLTFVILLATTGFLSLGLRVFGGEQSITLQTILAIVGLLGAGGIIGSAMHTQQRLKWLAILAPAFGLVLLGVMFLPNLRTALLGGAFGWVLVGLFLFGRNRAPQEYQAAIKALRKNDYATAVDIMTGLIKEERDEPNHYRFRAELLRLWGKTGRARRDYRAMLERSSTDAEKAVAYNGIAEVELQAGNLDDALAAAQQAYALAPDEWVAAYNLGMIEDRLGHSENVLTSLQNALDAGVPDSRHRLLVHLWLARAYLRQGDETNAQEHITQMESERGGLREWSKIIDDEQAVVLRNVLEDDIRLAQQITNDERDLSALTAQTVS